VGVIGVGVDDYDVCCLLICFLEDEVVSRWYSASGLYDNDDDDDYVVLSYGN
jgi:hypothetical protein